MSELLKKSLTRDLTRFSDGGKIAVLIHFFLRFPDIQDEKKPFVYFEYPPFAVIEIKFAVQKNKYKFELCYRSRNGDPVSKSYISRVMRECIKEACG